MLVCPLRLLCSHTPFSALALQQGFVEYTQFLAAAVAEKDLLTRQRLETAFYRAYRAPLDGDAVPRGRRASTGLCVRLAYAHLHSPRAQGWMRAAETARYRADS